MDLKEHITSRLQVMKAKRHQWEPMWKKAAELCSIDASIYEEAENHKYKQKVFDTTARNSLTYFAASFKSILVPSTQKWHSLKPTNPLLEKDEEVFAYLQDVRDLLFKVRYAANSQFPYQTDILFNQIGVYGHAVWYVGDNIGKGIIYKCIPINEVYVDEDAEGRIDTVYREFTLTARQAFQEYGEALSEDIKKHVSSNPDQKFKFIHAVEPRKDFNPQSMGVDRFPIASYHIEDGTRKVIRESGYRTMPYMVPHFLKQPDSPYGDSPALQAFYDMLTANEMGKTILRTGQLQANPPVLTGHSVVDASKLGQAGAIIRGGVDSQGRPMAVSMQYGNNLNISADMLMQTQAAIQRAFLVPLFQALTQEKQMTATEVEKREMEKAMVLAPMCERISAEWLSAMITREIDILSQYGYLDNVPDALMHDGSIAIEFESPYIRMQETSQIVGLYKTIEAAATMSQTDPTVLDAFNMQKALRKIAQFNDVDHDVMRTEDEIKAIGAGRAQMEQAQNLLAAGESITQSMKNAKVTANDIDGI